MSPGKIRQIVKLTDKEEEDLTNIGARAYQDVEMARAVVGGNDSLMPLQFRSIIRAAGVDGKIYVVEDEAEAIVSYAIWFPPGKQLYATEEQRSLGFNKMLEHLDEETLKWLSEKYKKSVADWCTTWLPKSVIDCWWLNVLATDPEHQQKGYATLLLKHAINMIPTSDIIGFGSTSEPTARFYEKSGIPIRAHMEPDMPTKLGPIPLYGHYTSGLGSTP